MVDQELVKYIKKNKPSEKELIKKFGKKRVFDSFSRGDSYNTSIFGNPSGEVKII